MALFTDVSLLELAAYVLGGPGALVTLLALVALMRPNRRARNAVVALALSPLIAVWLLIVAALYSDADEFRVLVPYSSSLYLAGLAALAVVLALAALVCPRRRALHVAGTIALVATLAGCFWIVADIRAAILGEFFWQDGATLVRVAVGQVPQRLALPIDRYLTALFVASLAMLVAVPLLAAATLRARPGASGRGRQAIALAAVALPLVVIAEATLFHALSCLSHWGCAPMGPVDGTPDLVRMWSTLAEQRIGVLVAGLVAVAIGSVGAVALARAGLVADNRRLLAAFAVFVVGSAAYLNTRAHAGDTATGPRRAFVGAPYKAFGDIPRDWVHPDFINPPTATSCWQVHDTAQASLVITADGQRLVDLEDLDELDENPRGVAAWEQELLHAIAYDEYWRESTGREPSPRIVEAVIDRAAPLARVLPYLRVAAVNGIDEVVLLTRHADVESTRTLGDVRVDKLCRLGSLRLDAGLGAFDGPGTWGDLVRATTRDSRQ